MSKMIYDGPAHARLDSAARQSLQPFLYPKPCKKDIRPSPSQNLPVHSAFVPCNANAERLRLDFDRTHSRTALNAGNDKLDYQSLHSKIEHFKKFGFHVARRNKRLSADNICRFESATLPFDFGKSPLESEYEKS